MDHLADSIARLSIFPNRGNLSESAEAYAPVICIPGSLGAGDSGDIEGPKCRDLTFDES